MPDRKTHIVCSLLYARMKGLSVDESIVSIVNNLIDHPRSARGILKRAEQIACSPGGKKGLCARLRAALLGMRLKGFASHDWATKSGTNSLVEIVEMLYPGNSWLVHLHHALDCIETGSPRQCRLADGEIIGWALRHCQRARRREES